MNSEIFAHELHVWELSFQKGWQHKNMILSAYEFALKHQLSALPLTTFLDNPWSAPAYSRLGFQAIPQPMPPLQTTLNAEASNGLPVARRLATRLPVGMLTIQKIY